MDFPRIVAVFVGPLIASIVLSAAGFGCAAAPRIEVRDASNAPVEGWTLMSARGEEHRRVWVSPQAVITNDRIEHAELATDNLGRSAVVLELTDAGAADMDRLSAGSIGQPVAVLLDDELISAPIVQSRLSRRIMILGVTESEADRIVMAFASQR